MNGWPAHPHDEWIDVTSFGSPTVTYVEGRSGVDEEIALARAQYVAGRIEIEDFAAAIDACLARCSPSDRRG